MESHYILPGFRLLFRTQQNCSTRSEVKQIWKWTSEIWEFLPPKTWASKLPIYSGGCTTTSQLNRKRLENETRYKQKDFQTMKGCLHGRKIGELCRKKWLNILFTFCKISHFSFTQRPQKLSQPNFTTCSAVSQYI